MLGLLGRLCSLRLNESNHQRIQAFQDFVDVVQGCSMLVLENIVTMDETLVFYYIPERKKQSKQWIEKRKPGPIKA
jgi:hypothetical protein